MAKIRTSLYVEESVDRAVAEMSSRSTIAEGVPELSRSEIYRQLINDGLEANPQLLDLLDEADRILYQRQRHVEREAKLQSLRAGFEARCIKHCKRRFEDGIRLSEVDEWAEGLMQDAQILWPNDDERRHEALEYVQNLTEAMKDAIRGTDYDPLDPSQVFGAYGTVSEAMDKGEAWNHREEIIEEFRDRVNRVGEHVDTEAVATSIASDRDLDTGAVMLVIEAERADETPRLEGGEADD